MEWSEFWSWFLQGSIVLGALLAGVLYVIEWNDNRKKDD